MINMYFQTILPGSSSGSGSDITAQTHVKNNVSIKKGSLKMILLKDSEKQF